jgi:hypothetical protein
MTNNPLTINDHEKRDSLFQELLLEKLKSNMKTYLMVMLEKDIDNLVEKSSQDFETMVRSYYNHMDMSLIVGNLIFKKISPENLENNRK